MGLGGILDPLAWFVKVTFRAQASFVRHRVAIVGKGVGEAAFRKLPCVHVVGPV